MSCEWMFKGIWYFRNKDGLLPNKEIKDEKFDEIWGKQGTGFKYKFMAIMPVTQYYIGCNLSRPYHSWWTRTGIADTWAG